MANTLASYSLVVPSPNKPSVSMSTTREPSEDLIAPAGRMRIQMPWVSGSGRVPTGNPSVELRRTLSKKDLPLQWGSNWQCHMVNHTSLRTRQCVIFLLVNAPRGYRL